MKKTPPPRKFSGRGTIFSKPSPENSFWSKSLPVSARKYSLFREGSTAILFADQIAQFHKRPQQEARKGPRCGRLSLFANFQSYFYLIRQNSMFFLYYSFLPVIISISYRSRLDNPFFSCATRRRNPEFIFDFSFSSGYLFDIFSIFHEKNLFCAIFISYSLEPISKLRKRRL